jgi:pantoate--beta-alanine ligase
MQLIKTIEEIQNQVISLKNEGKKVGFVPTMGALHAGHISLIRQSNRENDATVCSIFVNPTQFNDPKDFEKYPVTLETDMQQLIAAHCDILFLPSVHEMYPQGMTNTEPIDFGYIAGTLEGEFRPGHFDGMAQIVGKLLHAVTPDRLYMGQKDYQQAMICGILIKKLQLKMKLITCPIKREKDGLAMSSRNVRLDSTSRQKAVEIVKTLRSIKRSVDGQRSTVNGMQTTDDRQQTTDYRQPATGNRQPTTGNRQLTTAHIEKAALDRLSSHPEFTVEYVAIRDAKTLKPIKKITPATHAVALIAVQIGGVRLIDNMLL